MDEALAGICYDIFYLLTPQRYFPRPSQQSDKLCVNDAAVVMLFGMLTLSSPEGVNLSLYTSTEGYKKEKIQK